MLPPNTILRERYRIISELGHGGMGAVYQAMDENLNCVVAVKETFATSEEHRRAFRREAELLANLSHPTLPRVMDHFTQGDGQFLVMQFLAGHDLAELLQLREQPFAVEKVLAWADQLLDALEELHSYDPPIVHRDIKPSNLKVTPKGRILLLDFGLAKGAAGQMSTADADSQPKSIYGYTPNYAPLEQIRGAGTDPRSDLYSLGATMWSLLTGKVPPDALSRVADKEEGKPDPLIRAHELNAEVPMSVSDAINRAMCLNRNQRPSTAAEMRSELRATGQPEAEQQSAQTQPPPEKIPFPEGASTSETMKMSEPARVSTRPEQPAQTMPVPKPPAISSRSPVVGPTVASLSRSEPAIQGNRFAVIGASIAVMVGILVLGIVAITVAVWRPWSKISSLTSTPASSTKPPTASQRGIELVWVPPGSFMMGMNNASSSEVPVHRVTFANGFYIGKYEVTQAQWQTVMGANPSVNKGCGNCPVDSIRWNDAQEFIRKLNQSSNGYTYRLPTEAEWEYACRAGTTGDYAGNLDSIAWYKENAGGQSHPVGQKQVNAFGLYDMVGNVTEWVQDAYHPNYDGAPTDGSEWSTGGERSRIVRGGSWHPYSGILRSASRGSSFPDRGDVDYGFRVIAVR